MFLEFLTDLLDLKMDFLLKIMNIQILGDLDRHNGRFTKTVDFPNGVYAYFATINSNGNPQFPYFVGTQYRSNTSRGK